MTCLHVQSKGPHDLPSGINIKGNVNGLVNKGVKGGTKRGSAGAVVGDNRAQGASGKKVHVSPSRSYRYYNTEQPYADSSASRGRGGSRASAGK